MPNGGYGSFVLSVFLNLREKQTAGSLARKPHLDT